MADEKAKSPDANRFKHLVTAIHGGDPEQDHPIEGLMTVECDRIRPSQFQSRVYFDPAFIDQLAEQYRANPATIQPILVRRIGKDAEGHDHELIYGEQRLTACRKAGNPRINAVVTAMDDTRALDTAWAENALRRDLNPYEQVMGILAAIAFKADMTHEEIIAAIHRGEQRSRTCPDPSQDDLLGSPEWQIIVSEIESKSNMTLNSFRINKLPILNLPEEILAAVQSGKLAYTKARAIANVPDEDDRSALLQEILEQEAAGDRESCTLRAIQHRVNVLRQREEQAHRYVPTTTFKNRLGSIRSAITDITLASPQVRTEVDQLLDRLETLLNVKQKGKSTGAENP